MNVDITSYRARRAANSARDTARTKNACYYRATALRVAVCVPAGCFRRQFSLLETAITPRRAIAQQCDPHPAARQVKWGCRPSGVGSEDGYFPEKIKLSRIFGGSIPSSPDFQPWSWSRCQRGRKMKQQKMYRRKSEVQALSKKPLY